MSGITEPVSGANVLLEERDHQQCPRVQPVPAVNPSHCSTALMCEWRALPPAIGEVSRMSLQDWFRALKIRRRRLADQRSDRHETEIAKRLRELLDTSRLIPPDSTPPRKPADKDES